MKIVKIDRGQERYFANVAPGRVLGLMGIPNASAIGAVEDGNALGIMIFTVQGAESVTIEWLNVEQERREEGIGALLIEQIFDIARFLEVKRVCVHLRQDDDFENMQLYLMNWGFNWQKNSSGRVELFSQRAAYC